MNKSMKRFSEKGAMGLLDFILVAVLAAVAAYFVFDQFSRGNNEGKIGRMTNDVGAVAGAARDVFSGYSNYGAAGTSFVQVLYDRGKMPSSFGTPTNHKHEFNGAVDVTSNGSTFVVSLASLPRTACIGVGTFFGKDIKEVQTLTINGSVVGNPYTSQTLITPTAIEGACNDNATILIEFI